MLQGFLWNFTMLGHNGYMFIMESLIAKELPMGCENIQIFKGVTVKHAERIWLCLQRVKKHSALQIRKKILVVNQNICYGHSKEPSHWEGSFNYLKLMFKLKDKKNKHNFTHKNFANLDEWHYDHIQRGTVNNKWKYLNVLECKCGIFLNFVVHYSSWSGPWKVFLLYMRHNDSFTILGLWVLGLTVSHINESNCKLMSPEHFF